MWDFRIGGIALVMLGLSAALFSHGLMMARQTTLYMLDMWTVDHKGCP